MTVKHRISRTALAAGAAALVAAAALPAYAGDTIVKDATTVTMSEPSTTNLVYGQKASVTGAVSGVLDTVSTQEGRAVDLELKTPNGWMPLHSADVTGADGSYSVRVPSSWFYSGRVRTAVPESGTHAAGTSETTATVTVKPAYTPDGSASSWTDLFGDRSTRWDPCEVITVRVNDHRGPANAVRQVRQALHRVAAATGLRFRYTGTSNAVPWRTDGRKPEYSDAALTIAWTTPQQVRPLSGATAGWGGSWTRAGEAYLGGISLDRGVPGIREGFGSGATWGALLLHELGHVIGLGHVEQQSQLMYPGLLSTTQGRYEAGDLAGFRHKGAMGGCLSAPTSLRTPSLPQSFATY